MNKSDPLTLLTPLVSCCHRHTDSAELKKPNNKTDRPYNKLTLHEIDAYETYVDPLLLSILPLVCKCLIINFTLDKLSAQAMMRCPLTEKLVGVARLSLLCTKQPSL